ncbi:guanine nucleotide-binding subunit alpha-12 isoform X2 [Labeo rohita]|uniref:Guanine nucleotide-binding subunit alpha-12 isoform X2 n=1 Tax=Labeo rohita TaxID=84645 RepID=A0A498N0A4_LABRO|nr:guanine nucleotide-binding subunit alpha-12 isoform X2 [Labeo rohita]
MDPDEEVVGGARPKRLARPPSYLQQYEVQYTRGRPVAEDDVSHTWESPVHRTPPPSFQPYITPPGGDLVRSDSPRIMSSAYQPFQQAEFPQPSFSSPQVADFITSAHDSELQHLRHEHAQLMQIQQAFQADLRELREVRAEVRELVQVAQSLRADLNQVRGQNRSLVQPTASQLCSPPGKPHDSTPLAEDVNSAELPPPWPEPHVDLMNQVGDLALSDMGATIYQPVMPETRKYSFVCPAIQPRPPQPDAPDAFGLPPPPTPKELRELLTPVARPLPANCTSVPVSPRFSSVPATSNPPGCAPKAEPGLRPVAPYAGSEYVYRGPAPTIPKFSRPDPGEFARLRIALKNLLPPDGTELFKYQILVDHLKFEEARMIADAYLNSPTPFTDTMAALHDKFGQPHQLALRKIAGVLESPDIKRGDISAFQKFALQVQSLVGLLRTLGRDGELELSCGSHVARLLNKLPSAQRAEFRRHMFRQPGTTPNLIDFSNWLRYETWCHSYDPEPMSKGSHAKADSGKRAVTILHGVGESSVGTSVPRKGQDMDSE